MNIGRLKIKASRWPWMPLERHWSHGSDAPAKYGWGRVPGMARFGGGWDWKLGFAIGGRSIILDLVFGMVSVSWMRKEGLPL